MRIASQVSTMWRMDLSPAQILDAATAAKMAAAMLLPCRADGQ